MRLNYVLKAQAGDAVRHSVFVGRWKLGELMIRPGGVTFHGTHLKAGATAGAPYPTREAFEAALDEEIS